MGEIRAGNIHIEAEDVRNDGNIISENETKIRTKKYSGTGNIISGIFKLETKWYTKPKGVLLLGIIASIIAGLILYFVFKII